VNVVWGKMWIVVENKTAAFLHMLRGRLSMRSVKKKQPSSKSEKKNRITDNFIDVSKNVMIQFTPLENYILEPGLPCDKKA